MTDKQVLGAALLVIVLMLVLAHACGISLGEPNLPN